MNGSRKILALSLAMMFLLSMAGSLSQIGTPMVTIEIVDTKTYHTLSGTNLIVDNETFNNLLEFDDDDFVFHVYNYTHIVAGANVTLINQTDSSVYASKITVGDGSAVFYNVPQGIYIWNVTWDNAPGIYTTGILRSDGPEAFVNYQLGNLDSENDDDDFSATVTDIDGDYAEGLNFTIFNTDTNTTYNETILGADGSITLYDIPIGNYTYLVTVMSGDYAGTVIAQGDFVSDGTKKFVHQSIGPFAGESDYYDLEVYVYFETTLAPVSGAVVNVTFYNGTVIDIKTTGTNGSVQFLDLPIAYINWTVTYGSDVLGSYGYNLTTISTDIRSPVITSPGDLEYLYGSPNITVTWTLFDEHPGKIEIYVNDVLNKTEIWNISITTLEYTFNMTGNAIGVYEVKLVAYDQNDNFAEDIIHVRIYENIIPTIEGPEDIEYYFTETGHSIQWNVSDDHLNMFEVTLDGEPVLNGTVNPEEPFISINVDGLAIGVHTYTLKVNDTSGNDAYDDVVVTVKRDDVAPVITYEPGDIYYDRGTVDIIRNWTATDEFMDIYNITVDGFLVVESDWTSETIKFDFSGLSEGIHYVILRVYDLGGNYAKSTVVVHVSMPTGIRVTLVLAAIIAIVVGLTTLFWYLRRH